MTDEANLHPPLRERALEAGCLAAIGLLALEIGAGSLWLGDRVDAQDGRQAEMSSEQEEMEGMGEGE